MRFKAEMRTYVSLVVIVPPISRVQESSSNSLLFARTPVQRISSEAGWRKEKVVLNFLTMFRKNSYSYTHKTLEQDDAKIKQSDMHFRGCYKPNSFASCFINLFNEMWCFNRFKSLNLSLKVVFLFHSSLGPIVKHITSQRGSFNFVWQSEKNLQN